jgi:hypothetical protein
MDMTQSVKFEETGQTNSNNDGLSIGMPHHLTPNILGGKAAYPAGTDMIRLAFFVSALV